MFVSQRKKVLNYLKQNPDCGFRVADIVNTLGVSPNVVWYTKFIHKNEIETARILKAVDPKNAGVYYMIKVEEN